MGPARAARRPLHRATGAAALRAASLAVMRMRRHRWSPQALLYPRGKRARAAMAPMQFGQVSAGRFRPLRQGRGSDAGLRFQPKMRRPYTGTGVRGRRTEYLRHTRRGPRCFPPGKSDVRPRTVTARSLTWGLLAVERVLTVILARQPRSVAPFIVQPTRFKRGRLDANGDMRHGREISTASVWSPLIGSL